MTAVRKFVDLEDKPDLAEVLRSVKEHMESISLREGGREIAVVSPPAEDRKAAIMAHAGSLKGLIDEEAMEEIYRGRTISTRSPADL